MILAIDIGNTNITFGCIDPDGSVRHSTRMATAPGCTAEELAVSLKKLLALGGVDASRLQGAALTSVVPPLTQSICEAVQLLCGFWPLVVSPGVKTGLNLRVERPAALGCDRVVDAVAAYRLYGGPVIVIDLGTATTVSVVDDAGGFLGGLIMPGVRSALLTLTERTAQLPHVSLQECRSVVGRNTVECMQSGVLNGHAAMLDGVISRIRREIGRPKAAAVATGGMARYILPRCDEQIHNEPDLILKGLWFIWQKNRDDCDEGGCPTCKNPPNTP